MARLSRRAFFGTTAAAGLAGSRLLSTAAASVARKRRFTIDLVCGAIGVRADQRKAIELAAQHGFESVQPQPDFLAKRSRTELDDLRGELKARNLVWGAAGLPVDFRRDEATFKDGMKRLPALAAGLARAGATRVGTWLRPSHGELTYLANFAQHARRLRDVARVLADHGQRFGMEYVGPKTSWTSGRHSFIHTMAETKELVAAIGQDGVGLVLDSWHWYTAGETETQLLSLTNSDVVACDLNDAPAGIAVDEQMDLRRELPGATGVIDLATFLGALVKIGYDGPIRAEPFNQPLRDMPADQAVAATAAAMRKSFALVE